MSDTATVETVSIPCGVGECGHVETGPATGRGSAPFKVASHRYRIHGLKSDGTRRDPPGTKARQEEEDRPATVRALATVSDIAHDVKGEGPPTERQLAKAGAKVLQVATAAFGAVMAETDEGLTDEQREEVEDRLTLTKGQSDELVSPLARMVAPTRANKRFGRTAVDVAEVAAPVAELTIYGIVVLRYMRERRQRRVNLAPGVDYIAPPPAPPSGPVDEQNPGGTATAGRTVLTSGTPGSGTVVDATMVAEMHRRRGG